MGHNPISASRACQEPFHALRRDLLLSSTDDLAWDLKRSWWKLDQTRRKSGRGAALSAVFRDRDLVQSEAGSALITIRATLLFVPTPTKRYATPPGWDCYAVLNFPDVRITTASPVSNRARRRGQRRNHKRNSQRKLQKGSESEL